MSQNQQAMTGAAATDSLAADMPSVPGAQTAKSIIEDAIHPHQAGAATSPAATNGPTPGTQGTASGVSGAGAQAQASLSGTGIGAGRAATVTADTFVDQVIDLAIMGETLTFGKRAVVTEEVLLQKRPFTEEERVSGAVRRERVTVEGADVVQGADEQVSARMDDQYARDEQGGSGVQDTLQHGAQNVQQGASDAKHGLDGLIDSAVDKLFGGHKQQ